LVELLRVTRPLWGVAAILAVTTLWLWRGPALSAAGLDGLRTVGPYAMLLTALGLAWWFNRGRSFVIVASLLIAWAGCQYSIGHSFVTQKMIYTAVVFLVPVNALLALVRPERGSRYRASYRWIALLAAEAFAVFWIGKSELPGDAWRGVFEHWTLRSPPAPLVARLVFAAALVAAIWRAYPDYTPLTVGNAGALAAFFIGAEWPESSTVFSAFMAAAGAILVAALLQESHQLAFRDELTGLPGRRALEERLRSLAGRRYAVAMVEVDHFKQFNDTHGHDIGDQVLKLVAGRLAQVGGGGIAYRYGGEEFSVLFPDRELDDALLHLEAIRASIERYRMAVRGADRPKNPAEAAKLRGSRAGDKKLSVTVSIGAAEPLDPLDPPALVLRAADEALYRAKQAGRNRVSK
jgi:diguanylate cyclase (GGDEF)-like protein